MRKALLRVIGGLAGLLLLAAAVLLVSWLWPLSAAQKRTQAALEAPRAMPGSNAYVTLAMLGVAGLTPEQRQARVDAYVAGYAKWHAGFIARSIESGGEWEEGAMEMAPQLLGGGEGVPPFDPVLCKNATGCLAHVRQQPQAVAAALLPQAAVLAQMDELAAHGHYHSPLPLDAATPMPAMRPLFMPLTAHALAHVQGDSQAALAGLCRDAGIGRMFLNHGESLLTGAMGGTMLAANAELFADVLVELPADTPLPATCAAALAPLTPREASNCASMQGEFAMVRNVHVQMDQQIAGGTHALPLSEEHWWATPRAAKLLFNRDKSVARVAETMGQACLPETLQAIAEDRPLPVTPVPSMWRLECAANAIGCILTGIAAPAYAQYGARQLDVAARLRLLQAVLWLREHAAGDAATPLAERLNGLPAELRSAQRPITVSADGSALETPSHAKNNGVEMLRTSLPPALRQ
ncbi:MAG: hypothetical protein WA956_13835 [Stenotrophomonas sp.]